MLAYTKVSQLALRALAAAALSVPLAAVANAGVEGVEIIAPAGPGGGYDQLARATQQVLEEKELASDVQVINVPGAGRHHWPRAVRDGPRRR